MSRGKVLGADGVGAGRGLGKVRRCWRGIPHLLLSGRVCPAIVDPRGRVQDPVAKRAGGGMLPPVEFWNNTKNAN